MTNIEIVPATPEAVREICGGGNRTMRGFMAVRDGKVLGIGGVVLNSSSYCMFANLSDDMRKDKRSMVMAYRKMKELARACHCPVFAEADENIPKSVEFLNHIGFDRVQGNVYLCQR